MTQPLLVYRSTVDHVVGPNSMRVLRGALPAVEVRPLADSYHVATLDNDAPTIFGETRWRSSGKPAHQGNRSGGKGNREKWHKERDSG